MKEPVTVTVYPTKTNALLIEHPSHGRIDPNGSIWPKDIFTIKRLADGSLTETAPAPVAPAKTASNSKTASTPSAE